MRVNSKLAKKIAGKEFIITAEVLPPVGTDRASVEKAARALGDKPIAVNVSDNHFGVTLSSLAASAALVRCGIEPVLQVVTRDRNRLALQSDLLGAASLDIPNVLCLSGTHQTLAGSPESANVYDIDSIQLIAVVRRMAEEGLLLNGTKLAGDFALLPGAAANPDLRPLELNLLRLGKKIEAGAAFIQTQAVFNVDSFSQWLSAARDQDLTGRAAILVGVQPLTGVDEAVSLRERFTDYSIPDAVVDRLRRAGDPAAQRKEGLAICKEIIGKVRGMKGVAGIHILSGGHEAVVPELLSAAGL